MKRTAPAMLVVVALSLTAQAADSTLTLACNGTVIGKSSATEYEPDPISTGLIVNFTNRTVQGTSRWGPYLFDDQLQIIDSNEGTIVFGGFSKFLGVTINGSMDRVTGDVRMRTTEKGVAITYEYTLTCRPTQRMF